MAKFIKTTEAHVESHNVVLFVRRKDDGTIVGRIITMTVTHAGVTPMTTAADDPPIADAIALAAERADTSQGDVSVVDPDGLWQPEWGRLA